MSNNGLDGIVQRDIMIVCWPTPLSANHPDGHYRLDDILRILNGRSINNPFIDLQGGDNLENYLLEPAQGFRFFIGDNTEGVPVMAEKNSDTNQIMQYTWQLSDMMSRELILTTSPDYAQSLIKHMKTGQGDRLVAVVAGMNNGIVPSAYFQGASRPHKEAIKLREDNRGSGVGVMNMLKKHMKRLVKDSGYLTPGIMLDNNDGNAVEMHNALNKLSEITVKYKDPHTGADKKSQAIFRTYGLGQDLGEFLKGAVGWAPVEPEGGPVIRTLDHDPAYELQEDVVPVTPAPSVVQTPRIEIVEKKHLDVLVACAQQMVAQMLTGDAVTASDFYNSIRFESRVGNPIHVARADKTISNYDVIVASNNIVKMAPPPDGALLASNTMEFQQTEQLINAFGSYLGELEGHPDHTVLLMIDHADDDKKAELISKARKKAQKINRESGRRPTLDPLTIIEHGGEMMDSLNMIYYALHSVRRDQTGLPADFGDLEGLFRWAESTSFKTPIGTGTVQTVAQDRPLDSERELEQLEQAYDQGAVPAQKRLTGPDLYIDVLFKQMRATNPPDEVQALQRKLVDCYHKLGSKAGALNEMMAYFVSDEGLYNPQAPTEAAKVFQFIETVSNTFEKKTPEIASAISSSVLALKIMGYDYIIEHLNTYGRSK